MIGCLILVEACLGQQSTTQAQDKKPAAASQENPPKDKGAGGAESMGGMMQRMKGMMGGQPAGGMGANMRQKMKESVSGKPAEPTLEEMLNKALKDNPDIRVAEAKVREADAELNRTRLQVTQKVLAFHHSRESQKAIIKVAEEDLQRIQRLEASKAVSQEDVKQAQQRLSASKAKLAEIEAEMPYLLGQQNRLMVGSVGSVTFSPDGKSLISKATDGTVRLWDAQTGKSLPYLEYPYPLNNVQGNVQSLDLNQVPLNWHWSVPVPEVHSLIGNFTPQAQDTSTIKEKVRKALETLVKVDYQKKRISEILDDLKKKAPGLSIHDSSGAISNCSVSLQIDGQVPLRTALQLLEDECTVINQRDFHEETRLSFVLRDYGLLFAPNTALPPDAVHINNLGGGIQLITPEKEKTPAKDEKKPPATEKKN